MSDLSITRFYDFSKSRSIFALMVSDLSGLKTAVTLYVVPPYLRWVVMFGFVKVRFVVVLVIGLSSLF